LREKVAARLTNEGFRGVADQRFYHEEHKEHEEEGQISRFGAERHSAHDCAARGIHRLYLIVLCALRELGGKIHFLNPTQNPPPSRDASSGHPPPTGRAFRLASTQRELSHSRSDPQSITEDLAHCLVRSKSLF
jgi:hypothetical protein